MRKICTLFEGIGITSLFLGGAAMDNPSAISLIMAFGGLAIAFIAWCIENEYN